MCDRCAWSRDGGLLQAYHDAEWGTPVHDDRAHFEHITLEAFQCGLNWLMMLKKREIFRKCLDNFDFEAVAQYDDERIDEILAVPGMLKNRSKVRAAVTNARAFIDIRDEFGSFDRFVWDFCGGIRRVYESHAAAPMARNELSDALAACLKRRGFKFLGPITVYSYLQACGMINDHDRRCFRYAELLDSCVMLP